MNQKLKIDKADSSLQSLPSSKILPTYSAATIIHRGWICLGGGGVILIYSGRGAFNGGSLSDLVRYSHDSVPYDWQ